MAANDKIRFLLSGTESLPINSRAQGPASRGGPVEAHDILAGVTVRRHFDLSAAQRAAGQEVATPPLEQDDVLALEIEGGFVLYTSAGRLADDLRRIDPQAERDGVVRLDALRRQAPATRGLGDWVVRALSVLGVDEKWLIGKAAEKAKEWGGDVLAQGLSWAGTKAAMWAIEQQLEREPGLYPWSEEESAVGDLLAAEAARLHEDAGAQMLLFIHGTGSSTRGSFGELRRAEAAREWLALRDKYGKHIYGFEHRTFSESPLENALALAQALPQGARLSVVSHSRGGLVGDLLCAAGYQDLIEDSFNRPDPLLAPANEEDRRNLVALVQILKEKNFIVERYLRVACPAQGTLLASSHIDAFLSALLHLIGLVPGLAGTAHYAVVKRVLLQIAKNRTDPRLVPGIEAMLPDSPLAALVGRAKPQANSRVAVVAGDIEGGGVLKRLGVFLTDYLLFEEENNDLVVDTESMFGGIARDSGHYVFDQGEDVSHFRYFANTRTRSALQAWLTGEDSAAPGEFHPIRRDIPRIVMQRGLGDVTGARPVVFFLPGIMGSHLKVTDNRIWFDFLDLARGRLSEIAYDRSEIAPDGLFRMFYGDLCDHLAGTHDVIPFAYDWRKPLEDSAALLAEDVDAVLEKTTDSRQPVRLMTHSMGGLVVRAMIARHRHIWDRLVEREGGRWVMLGTPNRGSHGTVESLLGLSGTMRKIALLHPPTGLQAVVDLVASFPGAVQLLPRPGFRDTGDARHDYYAESFWTDFKRGNDSLWFGKNLGAIPAVTVLRSARRAWESLKEDLPHPERIAYVAGYGRETPCGIEREEGGRRRLRMVGTLNGDGTVTHDSGLLEALRLNRRVWYMNADHAGLIDTEEHFPALVELLERGETGRLPQARPTVRGAEALFRYEPGPVLYPTQQELERALIGGRRPTRRQARAKHTLSVCCRAMDLRHTCHPILVGHYEGDAISGAEAQIDRYLVDNRLTLRHHLDAYAGPAGTVAVVLDEPNEDQAKIGMHRGAVVVGLGDFGELKMSGLAAAVRQGALCYLLQLHDRNIRRRQPTDIGIASVLLGYNSTTSITIEDSVATVIRSVMEANRQFADASGGVALRIERLEFIELFEDVAISVAKAVRDVVPRLARDADRLGFRIDAAQWLGCGEGMRTRLEALPPSFGYWPRMIVTAAGSDAGARAQPSPERPRIVRALRYVLLSMRARAEALEQQRQPGLVERLIEKSVGSPRYERELARALFHLLVPYEFKETVRQTDKLVLVVDGYTANLPWEMLVADDEPLIKHTAMVRQLASSRFRHQVRSARARRAYVIGNPSTAGYYKAFPRPKHASQAKSEDQSDKIAEAWDGLPDLPGAADEARAVADLLGGAGYQVTEAPPGTKGIDVINRLYEKPYRILHVSAHGVFQAGQGENRRTGVVLSDGLLLTAAEIGALDVVPDLVFLNCCQTGRVDSGPETAFNRLAYSIARELMESGVRAVIAAGWAVDDDAARHFAECFYQCFLRDYRPFGRAVYEARLSTYEGFSESNTWGAFQAYGEPSFVMEPESLPIGGADDFRPVAPQELVARIDLLRNELAHERSQGKRDGTQLGNALDRLLRLGVSASWSEEPEVLYALGRLYADAGDFDRAQQNYEKSIALEDKRGRVPVIAIQQLANMEVRQGAKAMEAGHKAGEALIHRGLERLLGLAKAASGVGEPPGSLVNAERCALIGSAYKRLATALLQDSTAPESTELPQTVRKALEQSRDSYENGQGDPDRPGFSAYNTQNRIALDALLGTTRSGDAALAIKAGDIAAQLYPQTRDYFDLVMWADGLLIARLVERRLHESAEAIVERYERLREKLPETARWRDSVVSQIEILERFYKMQGCQGKAVAESLKRIHTALAGRAPEEKPREPDEEEAEEAPTPAQPDLHQ